MPAYAMSLLATLAAAMLVLSGCSAGPKGEDDPRVRVVASTNIYGQIAEEIAELPAGWRVQAVHPLQVPGLDAERQLVVVQRAAAG